MSDHNKRMSTSSFFNLYCDHDVEAVDCLFVSDTSLVLGSVCELKSKLASECDYIFIQV